MLPQIDEVLHRNGGVGTRRRLLDVVTRGQLDHEIRSGQLVAPFVGALCRPWDADLPRLQWRAALTAVGPPAALSHPSALAAWQLPAPAADDSVHLTVPARRNPRPRAGMRVHRVERFPRVVRRDGLIVTTAADAVVSSWPLLVPAERRGPAIVAVRSRLVSVQQLQDTLSRYGRVTGRPTLFALIGLLAAGCESELEISGHQHVFDIPGLRHGVRQKVVHAGGRTYRLDLAFEAEMVAVELDGRSHAGAGQRDHDLRRDAALAAIGWLAIRYTHRRLTSEIVDCRGEILAILATRRR